MKHDHLPIDELLPEIRRALLETSNLVIEASPGAGKTTRVPPLLLEIVTGDVLVLEPRRIAARLASRRVASEMGEAIGKTVGYQVRFENVSSSATRLHFMTEGVLTRKLLTDPSLRGVDAVILDEFHERHIDSDLALALLLRLQKTRPELRIVVMSATLDSGPVAAYLGGCPVLRSEGRAFPLTVEHMPYSPEPLHLQVRAAAERLLASRDHGHILVFLPGQAEIARSHRACESLTSRYGITLLPLHGGLSPAEQDRAIAAVKEQKLLLATNVAESSVTVEGVTAVIDSGLARFASFSPWTGLPTLDVGRVSKASARQRAGRAGRTAPGRVLRLYSEIDFAQRREHDVPEILRSDLAQLCLALRVLGIEQLDELAWLDAPPVSAWQQAELLLDQLGASGTRASELARLPLSPRLARLLVEAATRGVPDDGCKVAALLSSGTQTRRNELLAALDEPLGARTQQTADQLRRMLKAERQRSHDDDALLLSVLAAFPDRVAKRRASGQIIMGNGVAAQIEGEPPTSDLLVALDAENRSDRQLPLVRIYSRVEPDWLLDLFPEEVREETVLEWNRAAERVDAFTRLTYQSLVLDEARDSNPDPEAVASMLAAQALEAGVERFIDRQALDALNARIAFAGLALPDMEGELRAVCIGISSFGQLRERAQQLMPTLEQRYDAQRLRDLAPATIRLTAGRQVKVHYESGQPPWIASRLQDFFGMRETPRIGPGRTPVAMHLLAPNQRAVQITSDLAGFWERHYSTIRKELMRRYPRHSWPEKP